MIEESKQQISEPDQMDESESIPELNLQIDQSLEELEEEKVQDC